MFVSVLAVPIPASAYIGTVTGCITDGYGSPTLVELDKEKDAKLRICTFTSSGTRTSGKLYVKVESADGCSYSFEKSITGCNGVSNTSTNITLPKGHSKYRIYIKRKDTGRSNTRKTCYFSIDAMKNSWWG